MANEEQLSILKQGVDVWNKWRNKNPYVTINLREVDLTNTVLDAADFRDVFLDNANLQLAKLRGANFQNASLRHANLCESIFNYADLKYANLSDAIFSSATIGNTSFIGVDLSKVIGLDEVNHHFPSELGISTFTRSQGKIPAVFLRGCGLSDWEIEMAKLYNPDLTNEERNKILDKIYDLQASQVIQVSPLFISYSHGDSLFVDKLEGQLNKKAIRFWRDIHDMKAGRLEKQIEQAINQNRIVLLVLSEHSLNSDWVEHEVRTARGVEKDMRRDVLCPIALDDSWKNSRWPARVMEQIMEYNILDFSTWEDDVKFEGMFRKLIDGLELFYKG